MRVLTEKFVVVSLTKEQADHIKDEINWLIEYFDQVENKQEMTFLADLANSIDENNMRDLNDVGTGN